MSKQKARKRTKEAGIYIPMEIHALLLKEKEMTGVSISRLVSDALKKEFGLK